MTSLMSSPTSCTSNHRPFKRRPSLSLPLSLSNNSKPQTNNYSNVSLKESTLVREVTRLCDRGKLSDALALLREDDVVSAQTTKDAIGVLIQACGKGSDIEMGRKVHEMVWSLTGEAGLRDDFVLNTRLVTMYSLCGSPGDSRSVFKGLRRNNLFMWNALLSAYTSNELHEDAIRVFFELLSGTEFRPDSFTLTSALKACSCSSAPNVWFGRAVHGMGVKLGLVSDVFVGNALVGMYGKCGFLEDALRVFDAMPERNVVSWNSMLRGFSDAGSSREGFVLVRRVLEEGLSPGDATLATLLPLCTAEGNIRMGKVMHGLAVKLGLLDLTVSNSLMDMYLKCGFPSEGNTLFRMNDQKNVVAWNTMIGGLSRDGHVYEMFEALRRMHREDEGVRVDEVTILNSLQSCSDANELLSLKEMHGFSVRHRFHNNELIANGFASAYMKCKSLSYAQRVFRGMKRKTVSSWNAIIGGLTQNGDPKTALEFYFRMRDYGFDPDGFSIGSLLLASANMKSLRYGNQIHGFALRKGFEKDAYIVTSLISMYIQCNKISLARDLFDRMEDKNLVCWNAMLAGYSQLQLPNEALVLFRQMVFAQVNPREIAITSVFEACSQLSALRPGKELHCFALKTNFLEDMFVACSVLDMYAKTGCMKQAQSIFDHLKYKDVASWNVVILGYGIDGDGNKALELFEEMQKSGLNPDRFTFIAVLTACNHAGLVTEGLKYLRQMRDTYAMEPRLEHYACVADMLGRAGKLEEALKLVNNMPDEPDTRIWSSLLSCCKIHGDWETGEEIARKLLESGPKKAENHVLVSNFYASSGKWDNVKRVRRDMKETGMQKDIGCSWIEIGGKVYSFVAGDRSASESKEMWKKLENKISKIGYQPNTNCVLHNLEEEEKIERLRGHSEKLAISFGLLNTKRGSTIRIFKNLRICLDCHDAAKFISKAVEREIIVRDNKRFHRFNDGYCSCSDYW